MNRQAWKEKGFKVFFLIGMVYLFKPDTGECYARDIDGGNWMDHDDLSAKAGQWTRLHETDWFPTSVMLTKFRMMTAECYCHSIFEWSACDICTGLATIPDNEAETRWRDEFVASVLNGLDFRTVPRLDAHDPCIPKCCGRVQNTYFVPLRPVPAALTKGCEYGYAVVAEPCRCVRFLPYPWHTAGHVEISFSGAICMGMKLWRNPAELQSVCQSEPDENLPQANPEPTT